MRVREEAMRVNEIYTSIQGEGVHAGLPTTFVRLQGCNLKPTCKWCDTKYAQHDGGENLDPITVVARIRSLPIRERLCFTGGEPLLQEEELGHVVGMLSRRSRGLLEGAWIEIFTNGSLLPPAWFSLVESWVVDVKTPSTGVSGVTRLDEWLRVMGPGDQLKFTVADEVDLDFVKSVLLKRTLQPVIIVSPVLDGAVMCDIDPFLRDTQLAWAQRVAEFCIKHNLRFSLQVHKVLYGNKRGV